MSPRELRSAVLVIAALAIGVGLERCSTTDGDRPPGQRLTFSVELPIPNSSPGSVPLAVAPDESRVVYGTLREGRQQLVVRRLDRDQESTLIGTGDAQQPAFSPDGSEIAFAADGKLKRTAIAGGVPTVLCDLPNPKGIAWGADGYIVFAPDERAGLSRIRRTGGAPEAVTMVDTRLEHRGHRWPQVLPGGVILFVEIYGNAAAARVMAESLDTGQREIVVADGSRAYYLADGHLVYLNHLGDTFVAPFDPSRLAITGPAVSVFERPAATGDTGDWSFAISSGGTLAYVPLDSPRVLRIVANWKS